MPRPPHVFIKLMSCAVVCSRYCNTAVTAARTFSSSSSFLRLLFRPRQLSEAHQVNTRLLHSRTNQNSPPLISKHSSGGRTHLLLLSTSRKMSSTSKKTKGGEEAASEADYVEAVVAKATDVADGE